MELQAVRVFRKTAMNREITPRVHPANHSVAQLASVGGGHCACGGGCPRCMNKASIPTPVEVSQPGDALEREADNLADAVMSSSHSGSDTRERAPRGGKREPLQRMVDEAALQADGPQVGELTAGNAEPMPDSLRAEFEPRFGVDFGSVRLHLDESAARSAASMQAIAYTVGNHVVFGAGRYSPDSTSGRKLIAHELAHVVQQTVRGAGPSSPGGAGAHTYARRRVQRQHEPGSHASSPANPKVSSDKWRADLEGQYRRAGFSDAANAVANCREWGQCDKVLTLHEAWQAYCAGRIEANLGAPAESPPMRGASGNNNAVAAGVAAPALVQAGSAAARQAVAKTALERAALSWGSEAGVMGSGLGAEGAVAGAGTAAVETSATAGVATGAGVSVGAVAVPLAIGVVVVFAIADLFAWASFQSKLHRLGYTILPDPLGVCIGNCHTYSAPRFDTPAPTSTLSNPARPFSPMDSGPFGRRLSPDDIKQIEDWISKSAPSPATGTKKSPDPDARPKPLPAPDLDLDRRRRRGCTYEVVQQQFGRFPCHAAYATSLSGSTREVRVITPELESADFDAINLAEDVFEVKTGYRWLAFSSDQRAIQNTISRFYAQATNQLLVAMRCGHALRWYFNDPYAASFFGAQNSPYPQYLRAPLPVPVWYVPFNCNEDSD